jgi:hypothetical protein
LPDWAQAKTVIKMIAGRYFAKEVDKVCASSILVSLLLRLAITILLRVLARWGWAETGVLSPDFARAPT